MVFAARWVESHVKQNKSEAESVLHGFSHM